MVQGKDPSRANEQPDAACLPGDDFIWWHQYASHMNGAASWEFRGGSQLLLSPLGRTPLREIKLREKIVKKTSIEY